MHGAPQVTTRAIFVLYDIHGMHHLTTGNEGHSASATTTFVESYRGTGVAQTEGIASSAIRAWFRPNFGARAQHCHPEQRKTMRFIGVGLT